MLYGMHVSQLTRSTALVMFVPMIGLAGWGSWFGSRCISDGCLGVLVAWLAAVATFAVQALLVLPTHAWALKRRGSPPPAATCVGWARRPSLPSCPSGSAGAI